MQETRARTNYPSSYLLGRDARVGMLFVLQISPARHAANQCGATLQREVHDAWPFGRRRHAQNEVKQAPAPHPQGGSARRRAGQIKSLRNRKRKKGKRFLVSVAGIGCLQETRARTDYTCM